MHNGMNAINETPPQDAESKARARNLQVKEGVRKYYLASTDDYLKYYETDWHHHMHYGFERDLVKGGNPTENLVRYLAEVGKLESNQRVLDSGCGVGGTGIWLAAKKGCRCFGLNLMHFQLAYAKNFAAAQNLLPNRMAFVNADFLKLPFTPGSFDAVIAIESFDHASDKAAYFGVMSTLLKPGGKLIIADGFQNQKSFSPIEKKQYDRFLRGWAVPDLSTPNDTRRYAFAAGFSLGHEEDITPDVMPHARAIARFGVIFVPLRAFLYKIGLCSQEKLRNAEATVDQYRALKSNLWSYRVYRFDKI